MQAGRVSFHLHCRPFHFTDRPLTNAPTNHKFKIDCHVCLAAGKSGFSVHAGDIAQYQ